MFESTWDAIGSRLGLVCAVVGVACFATVGLANALTRTDAWEIRVLAVAAALVLGLVGAFLSLRPFLETKDEEAEQVTLAEPAVWTEEVPELPAEPPTTALTHQLEAGTQLSNEGLAGTELEPSLATWVDETAALLQSPQHAGYFRAANASADRPPEERLAKALARLRTILQDAS